MPADAVDRVQRLHGALQRSGDDTSVKVSGTILHKMKNNPILSCD